MAKKTYGSVALCGVAFLLCAEILDMGVAHGQSGPQCFWGCYRWDGLLTNSTQTRAFWAWNIVCGNFSNENVWTPYPSSLPCTKALPWTLLDVYSCDQWLHICADQGKYPQAVEIQDDTDYKKVSQTYD